MSYILDAIKKAEKQRQVEQIHTLESAVAFQPESRRPLPWKKAILVSGVIFSMILGWFYQKSIIEWFEQSKASISTILFKGNDQNTTETFSIESEQTTENQQQLVAEPKSLPELGAQVESAKKVAKKLTQLSEADLAILGKIQFSVISYSQDDDKRFVMEGANIFREGDKVMGFTIVSIKKNTVIVDVKGSPHEIKL